MAGIALIDELAASLEKADLARATRQEWKSYLLYRRRQPTSPSSGQATEEHASKAVVSCLPLKGSVGPSRYAADSRIKHSISPRATGCKAKDA